MCLALTNQYAGKDKKGAVLKTQDDLLHNYNCLKAEPIHSFTKEDFVVVVICDGYDRIPASLKALAREKGFLDEEVLFQKGFMETNRDNEFKMKDMRDIMDEGVPTDKIPTNLLHCFQITTWDFGIESDILRGRRINFMFCIKQRNDGKNSKNFISASGGSIKN